MTVFAHFRTWKPEQLEKEKRRLIESGTKNQTFVNLDLFYNQAESPLKKLDEKINNAKFWISEALDGITSNNLKKSTVRWAHDDCEEARNLIKDIDKIFHALKQRTEEKKKAKVNQEYKKIEYLTVLTGGHYKPPETRIIEEDDILSDFFKEWRRKQKPEARA
ncbi:MAG: hypothetical protein ABFD50_08365 [Smithella sp.]